MTSRTAMPGARRLVIVLALLVTLLGMALRFYRLSNQSLWTDEIYSIVTARAPLSQIVQASAVPNNSLPTYFLLLRAVAGNSNQDIEFRARLISALAGTFSIPVFMGVVYSWRRRADVALMAGLLLAVNPLHIWYSQEARAYALMLFFGLLALLFFETARTRRSAGWWAGYAAAAVVAIALHKTAIIFPAICLLWHAWDLLAERRRMTVLLVHLALLVAGVTILSPRSFTLPPENRRPNSWLAIPYTIVTYAGGYSFGPSLTEIQSSGPWAALSRNKVEIAIVATTLMLMALAYAQAMRSVIISRAAGLMLLDLLMISGYAALTAYPYNVRYTLPALLGFLALAAGVVPRVDVPARAALAALLAVSVWADWQWYYSPVYRKEDSRGVAQWLISNQEGVASWTVLPAYSAQAVQWYINTYGYPELNARLEPARENETTTFPPVPDALIIGRHDHIMQPLALIQAYKAVTGYPRNAMTFAGFEIFTRNPQPRDR